MLDSDLARQMDLLHLSPEPADQRRPPPGDVLAIGASREPSSAHRPVRDRHAGSGSRVEPGTRRWLIERRRIGPVIRALQRLPDPLFRRAG
jgi:hypothetical protein